MPLTKLSQHKVSRCKHSFLLLDYLETLDILHMRGRKFIYRAAFAREASNLPASSGKNKVIPFHTAAKGQSRNLFAETVCPKRRCRLAFFHPETVDDALIVTDNDFLCRPLGKRQQPQRVPGCRGHLQKIHTAKRQLHQKQLPRQLHGWSQTFILYREAAGRRPGLASLANLPQNHGHFYGAYGTVIEGPATKIAIYDSWGLYYRKLRLYMYMYLLSTTVVFSDPPPGAPLNRSGTIN